MILLDMKNMPSRGTNPPKNGMDSVSKGMIYTRKISNGKEYPYCVHHGAMNKVGPGMWRGLECGCGAWEPTPEEIERRENEVYAGFYYSIGKVDALLDEYDRIILRNGGL